MSGAILGATAAAAGCAEAVVLAFLNIALLRSFRRSRRKAAIAAAAPKIRALLVDFLAGSNQVEELRFFRKENSPALAEALLSFRGAVAGGARERLCELALQLGLVHEWCGQARASEAGARRQAFANLAFVSAYEPCRRLCEELQIAAIQDPDDEIRISAARGLIQSGETETLETAFEFALSSNPLTRAVLAEDLRRYAGELSERAIPAALSLMDSGRLLAALEILSAWQRAVIVPDLARLLNHTDPRVRRHALRLAPLAAVDAEARSAITAALADSDPEVSEAAALAAGRLRMEESLPHLSKLVRCGGVELARGAAAALAGMPPRGWAVLETLATADRGLAAEIARTALAQMRGIRA